VPSASSEDPLIPAPIAVRSLAVLLGLSRQRLYNVLCEYRSHFDPPMYVRDGAHPRRVRILSPADARILCGLLRRREPVTLPALVAPRARRRKRNRR